MEYVYLNNAVKMPALGLGTFLLSPKDAENATYSALKSGYELIDTANAYMNERGVGRGIKRSGVERDKIFLSTKLWPSEYEDGDTAIDDTLRRLDTDYIDLLILHQPVGEFQKAYKAMERAFKAGKVRALGLSNFPEELIQTIVDDCEVMPQIVQVEAHPYFPQTALKEYLKKYDIKLMAWYPLGHGDKALLKEPVFGDLAQKYGRTPAQIILRWHVESGNVVIPGSKNPDHIAANPDIFDFSLTDEEMGEINKLDKNTRYYNMPLEQAAKTYLAIRPDFNAQE